MAPKTVPTDEKPPRFDQEAPGDKFMNATATAVDPSSEDGKLLERLRTRYLNSPFPPEVRGNAEAEKAHPLSYPRAFVKGKGAPEEVLVRNWKQQKRTKCGDPRCYYVLEPKRFSDVNSGNQFVVPTIDGGSAIVAECSWDPRHAGGLQFIPVIEAGEDE